MFSMNITLPFRLKLSLIADGYDACKGVIAIVREA
jgi:hypothetical protein